jgi:hypothetical protein
MLTGLAAAALAAAAPPLAAAPRRHGLDAVLSDLHRRTFAYFWETTDPHTGLAPDNWPNPDFCSIAATGFALTAYCIGARSGYVSRAAAARRTLATLRTFWNGPQGPAPAGMIGHKGFFYHFLHMDSGLRYKDVELSSVDTSLFLLGALTAAAYFDGPSPAEAEIGRLGVALYERVDWSFMARPNGLISMGWHPEPGRPNHGPDGLIDRNWDRYNEGMMVTLLALASPTHPSPSQGWNTWAATIGGTWGASYGETFLGFAPLFGHQYSHCWYDFRGIADRFMRAHGSDYFTNSARATRAQRRYAIANPGGFKDYGANVWGLTACRGPGYVKLDVGGRPTVFEGYSARGPRTGDGEGIDDGTIAPTAGASSIAFAPEICSPLIHNLRARFGEEIYGRYGFVDAFNPSFPRTAQPTNGSVRARAGWTADAWLGIDQGPILIMLENHRSGLIWDLFCRSPLIGRIARRGLARADFRAVAPAGAWLAKETVR